MTNAQKLIDILKKYDWTKPLIGLIILFIFSIILSPETSKGTNVFLKFENLSNILRQISEIGIIAIGMTLVILTGGIDLSVGSILAMSATITAFGLMDWQMGLVLALGLAILAGTAAGFLNGVITAYGKIQSFIVTLAMMTAARGFALFIADSNSRNIGFGENAAPESFQIFTTSILGIPFPVYVFIFVTVVTIIVMRKMTLGRYIIATGSNAEAAQLAGVKVKMIRIVAFTIAGALSALSGVIHCAQLQQGNPNDGVGFELDAIAAVVIGGTSLMGGKGSLEGTFAGVLIIGILSNILGLHGIQKDFQLMLKGAIIVAAVLLQERDWNFQK